MNREQYLRELEARLSNRMPPARLASVMSYYDEYFDEMGPEGEEKAMADLGAPADLSRRVMGDPPQAPQPPPVVVDQGDEPWEQERPRRRGLGAVWTVLLAILAAPIAIPLAVGLVAVVVALLVAIFALFLGLGAGGVGCVALGVHSAVTGITTIFSYGPATTMYFVGGGMLTAGVGILLLAATVSITGLCLRGLSGLLSRFLRRRGDRV